MSTILIWASSRENLITNLIHNLLKKSQTNSPWSDKEQSDLGLFFGSACFSCLSDLVLAISELRISDLLTVRNNFMFGSKYSI